MYKQILTVLFLIAVSGLSCTDLGRSEGDRVIATYSGKKLTLDEALENTPAFVLYQDTLSAVNSYAEQWLQRQVNVDHARRIGIQNTPDYQEKIQRYQEQLLETLLKEYILEEHQEELQVSTEEAVNYYQTYREEFVFDERYVRFRHLTTRTRTEAENANAELMAGEEWEVIVNRYSTDPDLQLRKSTRFYPVSMALEDIPPLHQNLQILGITERSSIHYYGGQYHFVQLVEEVTEGEYPDLDWLIPQIREWLKLEKSRRITNAYLRNLYLRAEANNEIEPANVSEIEQLLAGE